MKISRMVISIFLSIVLSELVVKWNDKFSIGLGKIGKTNEVDKRGVSFQFVKE
jgi:hypothetical protein